MDGFGFTTLLNVRLAFQEFGFRKNWNDQFSRFDEFCGSAKARIAFPIFLFTLILFLPGWTYAEDGIEKRFSCTAIPPQGNDVERARAENERPIVTVAKHRTVTLLPTSVGFDSVPDRIMVLIQPGLVTEPVEAEIPRPKRSKKKRVTYDKHDVLALPTLPFITSSMTASPLEEGEDHTESVTGPSLRTIGPSTRFVVLFDSSHHSGAKSADPEVDSLARSAAPVMTEATIVAIPADVSKDKSAPHPSIFGSSSTSERRIRTLKSFLNREWTVTKGFELNDGRLYANMIDHFTPPAFFKIVRGMEHKQLFTEFNRKWRSLAEEKNILSWMRKDKEIEEFEVSIAKARRSLLKLTPLQSFRFAEDWLLISPGLNALSEISIRTSLKLSYGEDAYIPSTDDDFNSAIRDLRDLNFQLLQELSNKKDASTWDIMDLLYLDDAVAETLGSRTSFPLRSFNLYDPFPSASVTLYGPSHLVFFHIAVLLFASLICLLALAFLLSQSKLISNASAIPAIQTSAVLNVGIPISAGMTAFRSSSIYYLSPSPVCSFNQSVRLRMFHGSKMLLNA
ncbi:hypothetical protein Tco_1300855 [Tanacetum coccineum]